MNQVAERWGGASSSEKLAVVGAAVGVSALVWWMRTEIYNSHNTRACDLVSATQKRPIRRKETQQIIDEIYSAWTDSDEAVDRGDSPMRQFMSRVLEFVGTAAADPSRVTKLEGGLYQVHKKYNLPPVSTLTTPFHFMFAN